MTFRTTSNLQGLVIGFSVAFIAFSTVVGEGKGAVGRLCPKLEYFGIDMVIFHPLGVAWSYQIDNLWNDWIYLDYNP